MNGSRPVEMTQEELRDLGFGRMVSERSHQRLLNRDGTFNVKRTGLHFWTSLSVYHALLTMSWSKFFSLVVAAFVAVNCMFAYLYLLCGFDALQGPGANLFGGAFARAFFFSVHTSATIGYGNVWPVGLAANIVVAVEALAGLSGLALATGLLFARFSRPNIKIAFSNFAVIAPFEAGTAFMVRIANARSNEILELEAKILFTRFERQGTAHARKYYPLTLSREKVVFFPLAWTIVHPIDAQSPLYGLTQEELRAAEAEFLVLLAGTDETFSTIVHSRSSYRSDEIVWNARFKNIFDETDDGSLAVAVDRLDEIEPVL